MERPRITKTISIKKLNEGFVLLCLDIYYKAIVLNIVLYQHKNGHKDQRSRIISPKLNCHICGQMIFDQGSKNT